VWQLQQHHMLRDQVNVGLTALEMHDLSEAMKALYALDLLGALFEGTMFCTAMV
jgi:hypothetical protein